MSIKLSDLNVNANTVIEMLQAAGASPSRILVEFFRRENFEIIESLLDQSTYRSAALMLWQQYYAENINCLEDFCQIMMNNHENESYRKYFLLIATKAKELALEQHEAGLGLQGESHDTADTERTMLPKIFVPQNVIATILETKEESALKFLEFLLESKLIDNFSHGLCYDICSTNGNSEAAKILRKHGFELHRVNIDFACQFDDPGSVSLALYYINEYRSTVGAPTVAAYTDDAMTYAVQANNVEMIMMLNEQGCCGNNIECLEAAAVDPESLLPILTSFGMRVRDLSRKQISKLSLDDEQYDVYMEYRDNERDDEDYESSDSDSNQIDIDSDDSDFVDSDDDDDFDQDDRPTIGMPTEETLQRILNASANKLPQLGSGPMSMASFLTGDFNDLTSRIGQSDMIGHSGPEVENFLRGDEKFVTDTHEHFGMSDDEALVEIEEIEIEEMDTAEPHEPKHQESELINRSDVTYMKRGHMQAFPVIDNIDDDDDDDDNDSIDDYENHDFGVYRDEEEEEENENEEQMLMIPTRYHSLLNFYAEQSVTDEVSEQIAANPESMEVVGSVMRRAKMVADRIDQGMPDDPELISEYRTKFLRESDVYLRKIADRLTDEDLGRLQYGMIAASNITHQPENE